MKRYASPRRGHCAACEGVVTGRPVFHMDEAYCCVWCVQGGPCICSYETDLADDGVDHLGLLAPYEESRVTEPVEDVFQHASKTVAVDRRPG